MTRCVLWLALGLSLAQPRIAGAQQPEQVKLRATLQVAISEPYLGRPLADFKELLERRSDNTIALEIIDKGKLYIDTQVLGAVASGAIEMGVVGSYQFAKQVPEITLIEQPFLFNFEALLRAAVSPASEIRQAIDQAVLQATGTRVLWWQPVGGSIFFSNGHDVAEPHAIKSRKVRVFSEITAQLTTQCGGHPTSLSTSKMHEAMRDGTVELSMGSITSLEPRELWKVADSVTVTNHAPIEFFLIINERTWQSLSPRHQAVIAEAAREAETAARERMAANEAAAYALARAKGMRIVTLTPDQVAEWRACSAAVLEDYMQQGGDLAQRLLSAYGRLRTDPCCNAEPGLDAAPFSRR